MSELAELFVRYGDDVVDLMREVVEAVRRRGNVSEVVGHLRALGPVERVDVDAIGERAKRELREERGEG